MALVAAQEAEDPCPQAHDGGGMGMRARLLCEGDYTQGNGSQQAVKA